MFPSRKKKQPSPNSPPSNKLASQSQAGQSQSQQKQLPQPVNPWSAYTHTSSSSPSFRSGHTLSTSATAADQLFLFGGYVHSSKSLSNNLYVISTQNLTTDLLKTSGDIPSPRIGHSAVLTGTALLIWGGTKNFGDRSASAQNHCNDNSFYSLDLVSREWTRIVVNGPGPSSRYYHTMTLVGSELFVFGGVSAEGKEFNNIWALDSNCLKSNPFWRPYDPAHGDKKPPSRMAHVSVTTGDSIIIFGGHGGPYYFNDTWSFNISTRKWTELQCTGSIPSRRAFHAAVLIDHIMYVFGGRAPDGTRLGDLTAFNLLTQRWSAVQDIGPSPYGRSCHAMACDGRRVFVLGGFFSEGTQVDETKLLYVLDTKLLIYPKPDSDTVKHSEKTTQFTQKPSAGYSTRGQPHQPSSSLDAHAAHGTSPFQKATTGASSSPRRVPKECDGGEGSTEQRAKLVAPDAPGKETRLEDGRLIELERQLSETRIAKIEQDRLIAHLNDQLVQKSDLLEKAEANAAEEKKRAGLELCELQAKLDESLVSRDHALQQAEANAAEEKKRALELRKLQAKLDKLMLPRDHRLGHAQSALDEVVFGALLEEAETNAAEAEERAAQELRELQAKRAGLELYELQAKRAVLELRELQAKLAGLELCKLQAKRATEANERSQELAEVHAKLEARESELTAVRSRLTDAEDGWAKSKAEADTLRNQELAEMHAKLEAKESKLTAVRSRLMDAEDGWAKSKAEADTLRNQELAEMHAKLEAREFELTVVHSRLTDVEDGWAKSKAEADRLRAGTRAAASLVNMSVGRIMTGLMERVRSVEAEMASLRHSIACMLFPLPFRIAGINYRPLLFFKLIFIVLLVIVLLAFPCVFVPG